MTMLSAFPTSWAELSAWTFEGARLEKGYYQFSSFKRCTSILFLYSFLFAGIHKTSWQMILGIMTMQVQPGQ
jgi:hypothetical protein